MSCPALVVPDIASLMEATLAYVRREGSNAASTVDRFCKCGVNVGCRFTERSRGTPLLIAECVGRENALLELEVDQIL